MTISIFKNPAKEEAKSYVANLIQMAAADNDIHASEIKFIKKIGEKKGLTSREIEKLFKSNETSALIIPEERTDRFDLLYDVISLMYADGKVDEREFEFCVELAKKLNFSNTVVDLLVAKIERALQIDEPMSRLKEEAAALIEY